MYDTPTLQGFSSWFKDGLKSWSNDELVDQYYDARFGIKMFAGLNSYGQENVLRAFGKEFLARGIFDYI